MLGAGCRVLARCVALGTTVISNNPVLDSHRVFLNLFLPPGNSNLTVFGADVSYALP